MKILKLFVLCIVVSMMVVTVVSAKEEYTIASCNSLIIDESLSAENVDSLLSTESGIIQGETQTLTFPAPSEMTELVTYLTWDNPSNSLTLTIYKPDGTKIGTYDDSFNGAIDGHIGVRITASSGYLPEGNWKLEIYGESVSGSQTYDSYGSWT